MALRFVLPGPLHDLAGGRSHVQVDGRARSVAEALELLWGDCPALRDRILTEQGRLRPHVNIFVDGEDIRHEQGLSSSVEDGSEIMVLAAVSGG